MKKKLVLIHKNDKAKLTLPKKHGNAAWIYMGRDYGDIMRWRAIFGDKAVQRKLGRQLQLKAHMLRRHFLDFIFETGQCNDEFVKFSSSVFEKNSVGSPLFLYVCYLEVLRDYLKTNDEYETVIIVSESWAFIDTIRDNFSYDADIVVVNSIGKTLFLCRNYLRIATRPFVFIYRSLFEYFITVSSRKNPLNLESYDNKTEGSNIIIRTWVSNKFFDKDGRFKDVYFNGLSEWLAKEGFNVRVLPLFVDLWMPLRNLMPFLRKKENLFILPWDYLKPHDILKILWRGFGQLWLKFAQTHFNGWNIKRILAEERRSFALSNRGLTCILQYYLFKRMSTKAFKIDRLIYTFENMLSEKLLIIALKRFYPNAKIIGFQHSVLYPLHLTLYISEKEVGSSPLPDKIVCSSELFRTILYKESYPDRILKVGPALRFQYLFHQDSRPIREARKAILVVLPGYKSEAIELMVRVFSALKEEDVKICVKPHPLTETDIIESIKDSVEMPSHKVFVENGNLSDMIKNSDIMVTVASSVIFDAVASGIPVLRIKKETDLDLDPLDWLEPESERDFIAYSDSDIRTEVRRALSLTPEQKDRLVSCGKEFVQKSFINATDETMKVFLQ